MVGDGKVYLVGKCFGWEEVEDCFEVVDEVVVEEVVYVEVDDDYVG